MAENETPTYAATAASEALVQHVALGDEDRGTEEERSLEGSQASQAGSWEPEQDDGYDFLRKKEAQGLREQEERAARRIQAVQRGKMGRAKASDRRKKKAKRQNPDAQQRAALQIQLAHRQRAARRKVEARRKKLASDRLYAENMAQLGVKLPAQARRHPKPNPTPPQTGIEPGRTDT